VNRKLFAETELGVWWSEFKAEKSRYKGNVSEDLWVESWQKPMLILDAMSSGRFSFVIYLDADTSIPILSRDVTDFIPVAAINADFSARLNSSSGAKEDDVHLVAPLKHDNGQLRFSAWFIMLRASTWSNSFLRRWLAHSECDCWIEQGALWVELLRATTELHNAPALHSACDALWSNKTKARLTAFLNSPQEKHPRIDATCGYNWLRP